MKSMLFRSLRAPIPYAASLTPSFTSFSAFIVPCRACLWLRLNLGSVPLSEGYRNVFGFLMLCRSCQHCLDHIAFTSSSSLSNAAFRRWWRTAQRKICTGACMNLPILVSLLGLIVLGRILRLCTWSASDGTTVCSSDSLAIVDAACLANSRCSPWKICLSSQRRLDFRLVRALPSLASIYASGTKSRQLKVPTEEDRRHNLIRLLSRVH